MRRRFGAEPPCRREGPRPSRSNQRRVVIRALAVGLEVSTANGAAPFHERAPRHSHTSLVVRINLALSRWHKLKRGILAGSGGELRPRLIPASRPRSRCRFLHAGDALDQQALDGREDAALPRAQSEVEAIDALRD